MIITQTHLRHYLPLLILTAMLGLAGCGQDNEQDTHSGGDGEQQRAGQGEGQAVSVSVVQVEPRKLQAWVYSQGTARSRQREFLTFTQQGTVSYVDPELRVGSPVKKGQLIAHQAPDRVQAELQAARAALAEAEANLALAEVTRRR